MPFIPRVYTESNQNCDLFIFFYYHYKKNTKKGETRNSDVNKINVPELKVAVERKGVLLISNPFTTTKLSTEQVWVVLLK